MNKSKTLLQAKSTPGNPNSEPQVLDLFRAMGAARELRDDPQTSKATRLLNVIDEICAGERFAEVRGLTQRFRKAAAEEKQQIASELYDALALLVTPAREGNAATIAPGEMGAVL